MKVQVHVIRILEYIWKFIQALAASTVSSLKFFISNHKLSHP